MFFINLAVSSGILYYFYYNKSESDYLAALDDIAAGIYLDDKIKYHRHMTEYYKQLKSKLSQKKSQ